MRSSGVLITLSMLLATAFGSHTIAESATAQTAAARIEDALQNITELVRPERVGYATVWDGNKYVQCRRQSDRRMRCEAAGAAMQPSLANILSGERLNRLTALGWVLDPAFGNYAQTFAAETPTSLIADRIVRTLSEVYAAETNELEIETAWVVDVPCPPRNGPSQNLAGIINDAPSMLPTAVLACSYAAPAETPQKAASAADLVAIYGQRVTAELQRLRINAARRVFVIFDAGIGYMQCMPDAASRALYCEAQSAESWPALAAVLTLERVSMLHKAGYADPGRAPNYWKSYAFDKYSDAAIASEILSLLYEVYGYTGSSKLNIKPH